MTEEMKIIDNMNTEVVEEQKVLVEGVVAETEKAMTEEVAETAEKAVVEEAGSEEEEAVTEEKIAEAIEEKKSSGGFFSRFKKNDWTETRDGWILTHLQPEEIMEYLRMEDEREKLYLQEKEARNKRIMIAFLTTICLIAGVLLVYLLKDNPTILITILYIGGLVGFFRVWKKSGDK